MSNKKEDNVWWQFHKRNYGPTFEYQDFAPRFRAELFDPDQWADDLPSLRREVRGPDLQAP